VILGTYGPRPCRTFRRKNGTFERKPLKRLKKAHFVDLIDGVKPVKSKNLLSIEALIKFGFIVFETVHIKGSK